MVNTVTCPPLSRPTKPFPLGCTFTTEYDAVGWLFSYSYSSWGSRITMNPKSPTRRPYHTAITSRSQETWGGHIEYEPEPLVPYHGRRRTLTFPARHMTFVLIRNSHFKLWPNLGATNALSSFRNFNFWIVKWICGINTASVV
jgi:hypothetical protein